MIEELKKFMTYDRGIGSVWYIASPYTHADPEVVAHRVSDTEKCVKAIIENYTDVVPFSPILYSRYLLDLSLIHI